MTSDIAELIERLETTPPGRHGADDCWQAAAVLQAQQAEIQALRHALENIVKADDAALAELRALGLSDPPPEMRELTEAARAALAQKEPAE